MSMLFGGSKDPELKALEKAAKNLRRETARAEREQMRQEEERAQRERERIELQERADRFDRFPEFVVREIREVTVKAANKDEAKLVAAQAFTKGQNSETYSARRHLAYSIEGDTIDRIRTVAIKVARFFD